MAKNMEKGMVLAMSAWYDAETYSGGKPVGGTQTGMSWMDGNNLWGGHYEKAGPCQTTTSDAGGPHRATFSDIRIGDIGTTMPSGPPLPPAPPAPPSPTLSHSHTLTCPTPWKVRWEDG